MDIRERWPSGEAALQEYVLSIIDRRQAEMFAVMPVRVTKDSDGHTVSLQPLIKRVQKMPDGSTKTVEFPVITDAPVQFSSGGGTTFTHPVKESDEGLALISTLAFDNWHQEGGIQNQSSAKSGALTNAIYLAGIRSTPRKINNISTTTAQLRSDDGKHYSEIHPKDGIKHSVDNGRHVVTMSPDTGIKLAAESGKHVVELLKSGITIDSAMKLGIKAAQGVDMKGALKVDGKISSNLPIGGGVLGGILQGGIGAILGMIAMGALMAATSAPPQDAVQQATYRLAALWSR